LPPDGSPPPGRRGTGASVAPTPPVRRGATGKEFSMASKPERQMALTMFILSFGYHTDAWRHPESRAEEIGKLSLTRDMVQAAERAKIHSVFFADSQDVTS